MGVGYGDYLEQLTYLLFLKMADEYSKPPHNRKLNIPTEFNWESLTALKGAPTGNALCSFVEGVKYAKGDTWTDFHQEPEQDSGPCNAGQNH